MPSESAPSCSSCGTAMFVGRDKADNIDWICHYCNRRWSR